MTGKSCVMLAGCVCLLFFSGCRKKSASNSGEELNPMNAAAKYGNVMSRTLKQAKSMDSTLYIKNKITSFQVQEGRYPQSLQELVEKGFIEKIPDPPKGMQYVYNPGNGSLKVQ
jgi:hypothetical protein